MNASDKSVCSELAAMLISNSSRLFPEIWDEFANPQQLESENLNKIDEFKEICEENKFLGPRGYHAASAQAPALPDVENSEILTEKNSKFELNPSDSLETLNFEDSDTNTKDSNEEEIIFGLKPEPPRSFAVKSTHIGLEPVVEILMAPRQFRKLLLRRKNREKSSESSGDNKMADTKQHLPPLSHVTPETHRNQEQFAFEKILMKKYDDIIDRESIDTSIDTSVDMTINPRPNGFRLEPLIPQFAPRSDTVAVIPRFRDGYHLPRLTTPFQNLGIDDGQTVRSSRSPVEDMDDF